MMEGCWKSRWKAAGEASAAQLDLYQRTANSLRRLLEAIGLQRRSKNITPTVSDYIEHVNQADAE